MTKLGMREEEEENAELSAVLVFRAAWMRDVTSGGIDSSNGDARRVRGVVAPPGEAAVPAEPRAPAPA